MRPLIPFLALLAAPATAQVPSVVTDIPPVHSLAAQVMEGIGTPVLLLDRGADAHDFQMRPSQARAVNAADLVVWIGPEMSGWLEKAAAGKPSLPLLHAPGTVTREFDAEEGRDHDHHDHAGHHHHHDGIDPHAWLDPHNAEGWLTAIAGELARLDPDNADGYRANAEKARASVAALDATLRDELTPAQGKPIILFHDAYGYFTDHYGLTQHASVADGEAATPGAARLAELRSGISDAACIFPEANHSADYLRLLTEGTDVKIGAALDPEGSTLEPGPGLYSALLTGLANAISDCVE